MALFDYKKNVKDTTQYILKLVSNSKLKLDMYSDHNMQFSFIMTDRFFEMALCDFKSRSKATPRYITEVTKDNIDKCKKLMQIFDLRHLDGIKGNFIINEKEYVTITNTLSSKEEKDTLNLIQTSFKEIVEQQQCVFDTFWNKSIPIKEKINEMEGNHKDKFQLNNKVTKTFQNLYNIQSLLLTNIHNARTEIILVVNSLDFLADLFKIGLENSIKYAYSQGTTIILLYPEEEYHKINKKNNQIMISLIKSYAQIKSIPRLNGNLLIVDNSKMLTISSEEEKDGVNNNIFGDYTDNKFIVNSFGSLLDTLLNERELLDSLMLVKNKLEISNKKLLESNAELKINSKNQNEFINVAAHELRTPTQAIMGYAEMMEGDPTNSGHYIEYILRNADRLEKLVEDLLNTARIESKNLRLAKEKTDIKELITTSIEDVKSELETKWKKHNEEIKQYNIDFKNQEKKAIDIFLFIDDQQLTTTTNSFLPLYVMVDRSRITQAILNIINNSVKSIGNNKGSITITVSRNDNKEKNINIQKNEILVSFKDTGKGIDPKVYPKLFEKFITNSASGTGLGLYISKNIIEAHDGKIWAKNNEDGKGAIFNITLPLIQ